MMSRYEVLLPWARETREFPAFYFVVANHWVATSLVWRQVVADNAPCDVHAQDHTGSDPLPCCLA